MLANGWLGNIHDAINWTLPAHVDDVFAQRKRVDAVQKQVDVARASQETFEDMKEAVDAATNGMRSRIEADNVDVARANRILKNYQIAGVLDIELIAKYRRGDDAALDSLYARQPAAHEVAPRREGGPTPEDLRALEDRFMFGLRAVRELRDQLEPDLELYWKQQQELDRLINEYGALLRKANVAVIAWARAHDRLAQGVLDPAKIDVLGIAGKAAGAANPIP